MADNSKAIPLKKLKFKAEKEQQAEATDSLKINAEAQGDQTYISNEVIKTAVAEKCDSSEEDNELDEIDLGEEMRAILKAMEDVSKSDAKVRELMQNELKFAQKIKAGNDSRATAKNALDFVLKQNLETVCEDIEWNDVIRILYETMKKVAKNDATKQADCSHINSNYQFDLNNTNTLFDELSKLLTPEGRAALDDLPMTSAKGNFCNMVLEALEYRNMLKQTAEKHEAAGTPEAKTTEQLCEECMQYWEALEKNAEKSDN